MDDTPFLTLKRLEGWAADVPLSTLKQRHLDWLVGNDVAPASIIHPEQMMIAKGVRADDGVLDHHAGGPEWFAFYEPQDIVYWRPRDQQVAWEFGRGFCLGQDALDNPATTALGQYLKVFADPLQWLQERRQGIFILRWDWAFDFLRDVPRVAVAEEVLPIYRHHMKPGQLPELAVITKDARRRRPDMTEIIPVAAFEERRQRITRQSRACHSWTKHLHGCRAWSNAICADQMGCPRSLTGRRNYPGGPPEIRESPGLR